MSVVHVLPNGDLIEHEAVGDDCVCGPDIEFVEGGMLVRHHSLDGREGCGGSLTLEEAAYNVSMYGSPFGAGDSDE